MGRYGMSPVYMIKFHTKSPCLCHVWCLFHDPKLEHLQTFSQRSEFSDMLDNPDRHVADGTSWDDAGAKMS
jgi:hypothetical protein